MAEQEKEVGKVFSTGNVLLQLEYREGTRTVSVQMDASLYITISQVICGPSKHFRDN